MVIMTAASDTRMRAEVGELSTCSGLQHFHKGSPFVGSRNERIARLGHRKRRDVGRIENARQSAPDLGNLAAPPAVGECLHEVSDLADARFVKLARFGITADFWPIGNER